MRLVPGFRLYFCSACNNSVLAPKKKMKKQTSLYPLGVYSSTWYGRGAQARPQRVTRSGEPLILLNGDAFNMLITRILDARAAVGPQQQRTSAPVSNT